MKAVKITFAILASLLLDGCAHALEVPQGYSISEIPYAAHQMQWIDNETVLFAGRRRISGTSNRDSTWEPQGVYRWNVTNGQVIELMKAGEGAGMLCYDRGYLFVAFNRGEERVIRQGPIGQEKEIIYNRRGESPFKGAFNPYNCRHQTIPPATQADRGVIALLRDDHGFIEAERPSEPLPQRTYFLVRPSGERISLNNFRGGGGAPRYSEFFQAYIFQDGGSDLSGSADKHTWIVRIDGAVMEYKLPKGAWMSGSIRTMPVRDGLLIISQAILAKGEGAYVMRQEKVELLIKGYVGGFAVAPDGCNVAMSIRPGDYDGDALTRNVRINICPGRS